MTQAIEGGGTEHLVGRKRIASLAEIEIAGQDRGSALVAFGYQVVEVLVMRRPQGFQAEVVDDQQIGFGKVREAPLEDAGGARGPTLRKIGAMR